MAEISILVSTNLNANLLRGELLPLVELTDVREVIVVQDQVGPAMPKVRYVALGAKRLGKVVHVFRRVIALCAQIARSRPSVLMGVYMTPHGLIAYLLGRLTRRCVGIHVIGGPGEVRDGGYWVDQWRSRRPWLERLYLHVLRRADVVMVTGTETKRYLATHGVAEDRIHLMSQKIDARRFQRAREARHEYDLILTAQLIPRKRVDVFLRIVADLRARHPEIRAAVLGDGPLRGELERLAEGLGIANHVDFLGFHEDTERHYNRARIFVLTSAAEGLSVAMMEAMCCGLPAVVPAVGDHGDIVRNGVTGYLVDPDDPAAFIAALSGLLEQEERRRALGENARAAILHGYTIEDGARGWRVALQNAFCYS